MRMGAEWVVQGRQPESPRFDFASDLFCTADANGYFVSLNAAWERLLGWSREELQARPFIELVHPEDVQSTIEASSKILEADYELASFENRYRTKSGDWRWLQWNARTDGQTWFAIAFDVTESKEAAERIRRSLRQERLLAYSQPILDQSRGRVAQEELLVRLRADVEGDEVMRPAEFLPEAERSDMIGMIDCWMAERAVELASAGRSVDVNISGRSIVNGVAGEIKDMLRVASPTPGKLVFEITETAAIENLDAARKFVDELGSLGAEFALDDFGTGFGSLTYLRHLPVQYLKIDTSFVRDVASNPDDQALVKSVVSIGRHFGHHTVAEGVEDGNTLNLLRDYQVDYAQGHFIGRPAPLAHVDGTVL
jgi:PAS domain S-box-containing protein